jgi:hypothetical protein
MGDTTIITVRELENWQKVTIIAQGKKMPEVNEYQH